MVQNLYKTDSGFQKLYEELGQLYTSCGKSKSWNSVGYICLKTTFLHLKHYLRIYLTLLWNGFGKLLVVWKMTRNMANFHQNTGKSQNWDFNVLHESILCHLFFLIYTWTTYQMIHIVPNTKQLCRWCVVLFHYSY